MLEVKSMISKVLRHFHVSVDPSTKEPELVAEVVLKAWNGTMLNLTKRA